MKNAGTFIFTFISVSLITSFTASAYLDPGTGSIILQTLAVSALAIGVGWRFLGSYIKKLFGKKTDEVDDDEEIEETDENADEEDEQ